MQNVADVAFLFTVIVFVFAVLPALVADRRSRRTRGALVALNIDLSGRGMLPWQEDDAAR
jgi:hypothetical protein